MTRIAAQRRRIRREVSRRLNGLREAHRKCRGAEFPPRQEPDRRNCRRGGRLIDKKGHAAHEERESWLHRERADGQSWSCIATRGIRRKRRAKLRGCLVREEIPERPAERKFRRRGRAPSILWFPRHGRERREVAQLRG